MPRNERPLPDLPEASLHTMHSNASAEIERIEDLRRTLLGTLNENGTEVKADEDTILDAVRAEMDSAEQALQIALANKEDAEARQGDLTALKEEENVLREQLAALAEERIEAINVRNEVGERLDRGRHKDRSLN